MRASSTVRHRTSRSPERDRSSVTLAVSVRAIDATREPAAVRSVRSSGPLPVGHAPVEGHPLLAGAVQQVEVDLVAEGLLGDGRGLPQLDGVDEVPGDPGEVVLVVAAAVEGDRRLDLVADAVEPARDRGREGQVRVGVAARDAALDPGAGPVTDLAEAQRPVVDPPADGRRRPRAGLEALVAVDVRGEQDGELLRGRQQAAEVPAESRWSVRARRRRVHERAPDGRVPQAGVDAAGRAPSSKSYWP